MYELLQESIKPELFVLIPVLYLVGMAIKNSQLSNRYIPYILGGISILLTLVYLTSTNTDFTFQGILMLIFTGVTQGILIAGASVYVNQLIKQGKEFHSGASTTKDSNKNDSLKG